MSPKSMSNQKKILQMLKGELGLLLILAVLCIVFGVISPYFWVQRNLLNITRQVSIRLLRCREARPPPCLK